MSVITLEDLALEILNEFNYISERKFHSIAFLCEAKYLHQTGTRLTEGEYIELLTGVYSRDLEESIRDNNNLEFEEIRIGGDERKVINVESTTPISVPESVSECVNEIVSEFGENEDTEPYAKSLIPTEITLTTTIPFDELYESPPSLYEQL